MTFTYDVAEIATDQRTQVRYLIGDTKPTEALLQDEEIDFSLSVRSSIWGAAAMACRAIAAAYSRDADSVQGELKTMYSARAKAYNARAGYYEQESASRGGSEPFTGGISVADKTARNQDPDTIPPDFNRGMTDNWIPVAPSGNQTDTPVADSGFTGS